jgi:hypothetical protein
MGRWADFSAGRPSGAALVAAGFEGVLCYTGLGSAGKRITGSQYRDYKANNLGVLLVAELHTTDAWEGANDYALAQERARIALADARAQGIPDSVGIACAADAHVSPDPHVGPAQIQDAVRYAAGFASVVGKGRAGFYGFSETSRAVHAADVVGWHWRCGTEPTAEDKKWVNFWQRNTAPTVIWVSGIPCDINEVIRPLNQEEDMSWDEKSGVVAASDPQHEYTMKEIEVGTNKALWERVVPALERIEAGVGQLSDDEANIIETVRSGGVDAAAFAALVGPMIQAGASKEEIQAAVNDGLRDAFTRAGQ